MKKKEFLYLWAIYYIPGIAYCERQRRHDIRFAQNGRYIEILYLVKKSGIIDINLLVIFSYSQSQSHTQT